MTYWLVYGKRYDNKKEALNALLKLFVGSVGEYGLIDSWNLYCHDSKKESQYIFWTRDLNEKEKLEKIQNEKLFNPECKYYVERENGCISSNCPVEWINFDALTDYLIETGQDEDYTDLIEIKE